MDFEDTAEEAAFRAEARAWLEANVPTEEEMAGMDGMARAKFWQKRKADGGWACIRWPEEYGGRGASAIQNVILGQEEAKVDLPVFRTQRDATNITIISGDSALLGVHSVRNKDGTNSGRYTLVFLTATVKTAGK